LEGFCSATQFNKGEVNMNQFYANAVTGSVVGQTSLKTQDRVISTLDMALDELAGKVSAAEFGFERLADKLKPVRSAVESPSTQEFPSPSPSCQVEERILQMALRIQSLQAQIDLVNMQVCV
jgi:hypothetical protein